MPNEQEVQVQTRGPDGGNPTLKRQGRRSPRTLSPREGGVWWKP